MIYRDCFHDFIHDNSPVLGGRGGENNPGDKIYIMTGSLYITLIIFFKFLQELQVRWGIEDNSYFFLISQ